MSSLKARIQEDMKAAMRAKDGERLGAIRLLQAAIKQREVDERVELDDVQVTAIVEKLLKQRADSIEQFRAAGRDDLVAKEQAETSVLQAYMPERLSDAEVRGVIDEAVRSSGAKGPADMGKVMAIVKPALAGRADMGAVSGLVKQALSTPKGA